MEKVAEYYGLRFNKSKCVSMNFNTEEQVCFEDGTKVWRERGDVTVASAPAIVVLNYEIAIRAFNGACAYIHGSIVAHVVRPG